jgi:ribonuclease HI
MESETPHYTLTFDGGSKGNPGLGYGSYEIRTSDNRFRVERREFGDAVTNNEAEYRALIEGLSDIVRTLQKNGKDPHAYCVKVLGDSQLVIKQLNGQYKVKHPGMLVLNEQAKALASQFARVTFNWHERSNSVKILGH